MKIVLNLSFSPYTVNIAADWVHKRKINDAKNVYIFLNYKQSKFCTCNLRNCNERIVPVQLLLLLVFFQIKKTSPQTRRNPMNENEKIS